MHYRYLAAFALPLTLAACDIPGLVAHGVKNYESTRGDAAATAAQAPEQAPVARQEPAPEPPPPVAATSAKAPPRESINVEPLK